MIVVVADETELEGAEQIVGAAIRDWVSEAGGVAVFRCHVAESRGGSVEVDALVCTPQGVTVVEVKGFTERQAGILATPPNGPWTIDDEPAALYHATRVPNPFVQVRRQVFAVKNLLQQAGIFGWVNAVIALVPQPGSAITLEETRIADGYRAVLVDRDDPTPLHDYFHAETGRTVRLGVHDVGRVFTALNLHHLLPGPDALTGQGFPADLDTTTSRPVTPPPVDIPEPPAEPVREPSAPPRMTSRIGQSATPAFLAAIDRLAHRPPREDVDDRAEVERATASEVERRSPRAETTESASEGPGSTQSAASTNREDAPAVVAELPALPSAARPDVVPEPESDAAEARTDEQASRPDEDGPAPAAVTGPDVEPSSSATGPNTDTVSLVKAVSLVKSAGPAPRGTSAVALGAAPHEAEPTSAPHSTAGADDQFASTSTGTDDDSRSDDAPDDRAASRSTETGEESSDAEDASRWDDEADDGFSKRSAATGEGYSGPGDSARWDDEDDDWDEQDPYEDDDAPRSSSWSGAATGSQGSGYGRAAGFAAAGAAGAAVAAHAGRSRGPSENPVRQENTEHWSDWVERDRTARQSISQASRPAGGSWLERWRNRPVRERRTSPLRRVRVGPGVALVLFIALFGAGFFAITAVQASRFEMSDYDRMCGENRTPFPNAAAYERDGPSPIYLSGDLGGMVTRDDARAWRPTDPGTAQLIACMKQLELRELVQTCQYAPGPGEPIGRTVNLFRASYEVVVYELRTGREVARAVMFGDRFSADPANIDPDRCRAAADAPDYLGRRLGQPSAAQVTGFLTPVVHPER